MLEKYKKYTDDDWRSLAALARQQSMLAGFYNENFRLVHENQAFLFRFPKHNETQFDPRPFREADIYKKIDGLGLPVPDIFYVAPDQSFMVQQFIDGALIDEVYPPGQQITTDHIRQIADFYRKIALVDIDVSEIMAHDWPRTGPMLTFFEKMLETSWIVYENHQKTHGLMFEFLNLPKDPFSAFLTRAAELTKRPWRLIHADIHRKNMIEREDGKLFFIDWELALYGDLLRCIAAHLHRSRFFPEEKNQIACEIYETLPPEFQKNYMKDLAFYLDFEALGSVITDTVRFPQLLKSGKVSNTGMYELGVYYADNLNRISDLMGTKTTTPERALEWFEQWAI